MRVLFLLKKNRKNPEAQATIYCRVKLNGVHANDFSTFIQVMPPDWDSGKQRIKGKSLQVSDNNLKLDQIKSDLTRLFLQFQSREEPIAANQLVKLYTGKQQQFYTFYELVDEFEKHVLATYKNKGTRKNYNTRIQNIRLFLEENGYKTLDSQLFNLGKADEFVRWCKSRGLDHQYIIRHTQILKNITESAVRSEIHKVDKLATFVLKKKERINTEHLTTLELRQIDTFDWRPEMRRIVDLFLFSCYTGLHYEDAQTLTPNEVRTGIDGRLWLFKPRGKYADSQFFTHESVQIVPLSDNALALIDKYGGIEKLPKISNSGYNDWLKQIQHMAGIQVKLTVRIARKTFTDMLLNDMCVSEESVAAMLGHNSTKHVKHYARVGEKRISKEVKWQ
ncbi:site-specific integrase [Spirosoma pomorum]